jgi:hypothetical protein
MNAHFCAVAPTFRIMELDPDTVPWYDDVNEEAVRAHPPAEALRRSPGVGDMLTANR